MRRFASLVGIVFLGTVVVAMCGCGGGAGPGEVGYWHDEFSGTTVDYARWRAVGAKNWGLGKIVVANGTASFRSERGVRRAFPTIISAANPFPAEGDWLLKYRMRYIHATSVYGDGALAANGIQGGDWSPGRLIQTWRDVAGSQGPRMLGQGPTSDVLWSAPESDTTWHVYAVAKQGSSYIYFVDGQRVDMQDVVNVPVLIVFGNYGGLGSDWSDFMHFPHLAGRSCCLG